MQRGTAAGTRGGGGLGWEGWWQVASTFLTCKEVLQRCEGLNTLRKVETIQCERVSSY